MKYTETTKKVILRRRPNPSEAVEMSLLKKARANNEQNQNVNGNNFQGRVHVSKRPVSSRKHNTQKTEERTDTNSHISVGIKDTSNATKIQVNLVHGEVSVVDDDELLQENSKSQKKSKEKKKKRIRPLSEPARLENPKFTVTEVRQNGHGDLVVFENPDSEEEEYTIEDYVDEDDGDNDKDGSNVQINKIVEIKENEKTKIEEAKEIQKNKPKKKKRSKSAQQRPVEPRKPPINKEMIEYEADEDEEADIKPVCVPSAIWQRPENRRRKKKVYKETMVRVGGGWMQLCDYLHYHTPVKVYLKNAAKVKKGEEKLLIRSVRPKSTTPFKKYDRPSWSYVSKGFKGFGTTVGREFV